MIKFLQGTLAWIALDRQSHPYRFWMELAAWAMSIGCSIVMAVTVPNPPLLMMYPVWILGCSMYAWAAYTRQSFGMLLNYVLLVSIDSIGLVRMIIN